MDPRNLNISWGMLWKLFFMVVFVWFLYIARDVVVTLLLAIVISTAFNPVVTYLERKKLPRILGTLGIYLLTAFILGLVIYAFVPLALSELNNLLVYSSKFLGLLTPAPQLEDIIETLRLNLSKITDILFSGDISVIDVSSRLLGGAFSVIAIFVLSFYLTAGRAGVEKFLLAILPSAYESKVISLYARIARKIGRWLTGQLFISIMVGLVTFFGLWLLGVKYSLFLGLLAGILEIIPYVGPILTGGIAVLIGLSDSFSLGVYVFILFVIIQQLENHILMPVVMRYTTALNPAVVLTSLLIGGKVFGVVGLILAMPIAVLFQEMIEDWADHKQARRGLGL